MLARPRSTAVTASCWQQYGPGPGLDGVLLGMIGARFRMMAVTASCWLQYGSGRGLDGVLLGAMGGEEGTG